MQDSFVGNKVQFTRTTFLKNSALSAGAIYVEGMTTVFELSENVHFIENKAMGGGRGGGALTLLTVGTTIIRKTEFLSNMAIESAGGAIFSEVCYTIGHSFFVQQIQNARQHR